MADGVFLWVALALQSLRNGLAQGDSVWELGKRLRALPRDLKDLYAAMWKRLGDDEPLYRRDAAMYLNTVLACQLIDNRKPLAIGELLLATDLSLMDQFCHGRLETEGQKLLQCDRLSKVQRLVKITQAVPVAVLLFPEGSLENSNVRTMCDNPVSFFREIQHNWRRYGISRVQVFEILSAAECILEAWPSSRTSPWLMVPWIDILGVASSEYAHDFLLDRLRTLDEAGQVSVEYNGYTINGDTPAAFHVSPTEAAARLLLAANVTHCI